MNTKEKAIMAFNEIRDLPYHISIDGEKGMNCTNKARLLAKKLRQLGYDTREIVGMFKWSDCKLPEDLIQHCRIDEDFHLWLEVKAPQKNNWETVDPTWNSELENAGLPISSWDGINSTIIAVKPHKIFTPVESIKFLEKDENPETWLNAKKFYKHFNKYCDSFLNR